MRAALDALLASGYATAPVPAMVKATDIATKYRMSLSGARLLIRRAALAASSAAQTTA